MRGMKAAAFPINRHGVFNRCGALYLMAIFCVLAAAKYPNYPVRMVGDYTISVEKAGFAIGVETLDDPKEQRVYFKAEMTRQGLVPVFVVMQNRSIGDTFLFDVRKAAYWPVSVERDRAPALLTGKSRWQCALPARRSHAAQRWDITEHLFLKRRRHLLRRFD